MQSRSSAERAVMKTATPWVFFTHNTGSPTSCAGNAEPLKGGSMAPNKYPSSIYIYILVGG